MKRHEGTPARKTGRTHVCMHYRCEIALLSWATGLSSRERRGMKMARTRSVESIRREIEELRRKETALKAEAKEMERRREERRMHLVAAAVLRHAGENEAFGKQL